MGDSIRDAYGNALAELGRKNERVVALEADVGGSTKCFWRRIPGTIF